MACRGPGIRRLILASASPRRQQLFSLLGLPYVVKAAGVDEQGRDGESPRDLVLRVSQAKALATGVVRPDELVVAADTTVALDGEPLGKPVDANDAARMLRALRCRAHTVYSSVSIWHPAGPRMLSEVAESTVWMRDYSDAQIDAYVASGDPLDKAGAYAIQHPGFDPVARVEGCWVNVMGLPLCQVSRMLAEFGVVVPTNLPASCRAFFQRECDMERDRMTLADPREVCG